MCLYDTELWFLTLDAASAHLTLKGCKKRKRKEKKGTLPDSCLLSGSYLHESLG